MVAKKPPPVVTPPDEDEDDEEELDEDEDEDDDEDDDEDEDSDEAADLLDNIESAVIDGLENLDTTEITGSVLRLKMLDGSKWKLRLEED